MPPAITLALSCIEFPLINTLLRETSISRVKLVVDILFDVFTIFRLEEEEV